MQKYFSQNNLIFKCNKSETFKEIAYWRLFFPDLFEEAIKILKYRRVRSRHNNVTFKDPPLSNVFAGVEIPKECQFRLINLDGGVLFCVN